MDKRLLAVLMLIIAAMFFVGCSGSDPDDDPEPTVLLKSAVSNVVVGEVFEATLAVSAVEELAAIGTKLIYDPYKLELVLMLREDAWLTSGGGTVQQMAFNTDNTAGFGKIVLAIFPAANSVGDDTDAEHAIAKLRFKALSPGQATVSVSINNSLDSDLGVFNSSAALVSGIKTENLTVSVSASK
jgi:hypothetical protein